MLDRIDLVVMGTKGARGLKEVFIGSNTFDLAQKIDKPVVAVPRNAFFQGIKRIAFCSDFNNHKNMNRLQPLKDLAMVCNSEVRIIHVKTDETKLPLTEHQNESVDEDNFFGSEVNHSFRIIKSTNVWKGIDNYLGNNQDIEMVAVVNHKRSMMTSLLRTDNTRKMAFQSRLPILILN